MSRKRKEDNGHALKGRLDADLLNKLASKKHELKEAEAKEQEKSKLRRIEEKKQKEANKTFGELLEETDLDWKKFK